MKQKALQILYNVRKIYCSLTPLAGENFLLRFFQSFLKNKYIGRILISLIMFLLIGATETSKVSAGSLMSGRAFFRDQFGQIIYLQDVKMTWQWTSGGTGSTKCNATYINSARREVNTTNVTSTYYCTPQPTKTCPLANGTTNDCTTIGSSVFAPFGSCTVNNQTKTVDDNPVIETSTNYVYVFPNRPCFGGSPSSATITPTFPNPQTYSYLPIPPQNADSTWNGYWVADFSRLYPEGFGSSFSWNQTNQILTATNLTQGQYYNVDFEWIYYPSVYTPAPSLGLVSKSGGYPGSIFGTFSLVPDSSQCASPGPAGGHGLVLIGRDPNDPCATITSDDMGCTAPIDSYQFSNLKSGWIYSLKLVPSHYYYVKEDDCGSVIYERLLIQTCTPPAIGALACGSTELTDYQLGSNENKQWDMTGTPDPEKGLIYGRVREKASGANQCTGWLDPMMGNVLVRLVGTTENNTPVNRYTFTYSSGTYAFNNLDNGTYVPYVDFLTTSAINPDTGIMTTNSAVSPIKYDYVFNCQNCGATQENPITLNASSNYFTSYDYSLWPSNANCTPGTLGCGASYGGSQVESKWLRTQSGNVHSAGGFNITGISGGIFASDVVSGGGSTGDGLWSFTPADYTISNRNWKIQNYSDQNVGSFDTFFDRYKGKVRTTPTNDEISDATGVFNAGWINGRGNVVHIQTTTDMRITAPLAVNANQWTTVFLEGPDPALFDLYIDKNVTIPANSGVIFIVKGNVKIGKDVTAMDGIYIARQTIYDPDPDANLSSTEKLAGEGGLIAWNGLNFGSPTLGRKPLVDSGQELSNPAYSFTMPAKYYIKFGSIIGDSNYTWKEVAP